MDKEQTAIMRLQEASKMSLKIYQKPLIITTSGGKDSSVCVELALRAKIPFEVMHNHTTADAPETVYFVRNEFKRLENMGVSCKIEYPKYKDKPISMWYLIEIWGLPNRRNRFCCSYLKETGGKGRYIATGVRWAESKKREGRGVHETISSNKKNKIILNNDNDEKRRLFETCQLKAKRICNPIIDWEDRDVWDFLKQEKINMNPLYAEGEYRVGCVGCPLASKKTRYKDFRKWPKYKDMYCAAIERYIKRCFEKGKIPVRTTVEGMFHWWMEDEEIEGQLKIF